MIRSSARLASVSLVALLLGLAAPAEAQEQLAPLPPSAPPAAQGQTVIIQQPPVYQGQPVYQAPVYQAPVYQPGYQPYYVQAPGQQPSAAPRIIRDWDGSQPIPAGYHKEEHVRTGLVVGGAVLFGTTYLLSALAASVSADANQGSSNPIAALWVPGLGPFITMTQVSSATGNFGLALDGLAQLGGLTMFIVGLAAPKTELVRNDFGSLHLRLAPIISRDHSGMGLVGRF